MAGNEQRGTHKYAGQSLGSHGVEEHLMALQDGPVARPKDGHVGDGRLIWQDCRCQVNKGVILDCCCCCC